MGSEMLNLQTEIHARTYLFDHQAVWVATCSANAS